MSQILIKHLTLEFPIYNVHDRSFKRTLFGATRQVGGPINNSTNGRAIVVGLDDINVEIKAGERVGLLGLNGAGKSTLLRALAGIYEPTRGRILTQGSIVSLFDISVGMDPDLNAYQNINLRALLLGFSRKQIDALAPEIEDFTELGEYMRMPLRTYSTGMMMRLAFAISAFADPDILLMDEWIATGDARIITKIEARLEEMVTKSSIMVIATHAPQLLLRLCPRTIILHHGRIIADGETKEMVQKYAELCAQ